MLQPTGQAALARLGLLAEIEALGARVDRLHGVTDKGATIFDLAYADLDARYYAIGIHRAALHGALWRAFADCNASLETGRALRASSPFPAARRRCSMRAARPDRRFDLVLDASGARSPLRGAVTGHSAKPFAYGAVWASVPDLGLASGRLAQRYVAARVMIGYLPIGRAEANGPPLAALFWSLKTADYDAWRANFVAVARPHRRSLARAKPNIERLQDPDDLALASYVHFTAARPFRGPLALVGDAAHATSPQLGQGANNGLLDALALRDALASATTSARRSRSTPGHGAPTCASIKWQARS